MAKIHSLHFVTISPAIFSVICHMEVALNRIKNHSLHKKFWLHLLKKSLMENFFCAVTCVDGKQKQLFLGVQQNISSEKSHQVPRKIAIS